MGGNKKEVRCSEQRTRSLDHRELFSTNAETTKYFLATLVIYKVSVNLNASLAYLSGEFKP